MVGTICFIANNVTNEILMSRTVVVFPFTCYLLGMQIKEMSLKSALEGLF